MKNVFELITYNKHKLAFYYLSILFSLNEGSSGEGVVIDAS